MSPPGTVQRGAGPSAAATGALPNHQHDARSALRRQERQKHSTRGGLSKLSPAPANKAPPTKQPAAAAQGVEQRTAQGKEGLVAKSRQVKYPAHAIKAAPAVLDTHVHDTSRHTRRGMPGQAREVHDSSSKHPASPKHVAAAAGTSTRGAQPRRHVSTRAKPAALPVSTAAAHASRAGPAVADGVAAVAVGTPALANKAAATVAGKRKRCASGDLPAGDALKPASDVNPPKRRARGMGTEPVSEPLVVTDKAAPAEAGGSGLGPVLESPVPAAPAAVPKRRGRPPKAMAAAAALAASLKRKGRPPKPSTASAAFPKRRGRPPNPSTAAPAVAAAAAAGAEAIAPKRRGRPPKASTVAAAVAAAAGGASEQAGLRTAATAPAAASPTSPRGTRASTLRNAPPSARRSSVHTRVAISPRAGASAQQTRALRSVGAANAAASRLPGASLATAPHTGQQTAGTPKKRRRRGGAKHAAASSEIMSYKQALERVRRQLARIRTQEHFIDVYEADGYKGAAREKVRLTLGLERAERSVLHSKAAIRSAMRYCDEAQGDTAIPAGSYEADGTLPEANIFCSKCRKVESTDNNDILLCDGPCRRAYHQQCLDPPLTTQQLQQANDEDNDDEDWFCPACDAKADMLEAINEDYGSKLTLLNGWREVFPEAAGYHKHGAAGGRLGERGRGSKSQSAAAAGAARGTGQQGAGTAAGVSGRPRRAVRDRVASGGIGARMKRPDSANGANGLAAAADAAAAALTGAGGAGSSNLTLALLRGDFLADEEEEEDESFTAGSGSESGAAEASDDGASDADTDTVSSREHDGVLSRELLELEEEEDAAGRLRSPRTRQQASPTAARHRPAAGPSKAAAKDRAGGGRYRGARRGGAGADNGDAGNGGLVVQGKRRRTAVDYVALARQMFGADGAADSDDDDEWGGRK